jgi:hypothetical protein
MSYYVIYRLWFTNDNGDDVIIHISDTASGAPPDPGGPVYSDMKDADGNWLTMSARLSTANDSEDKLNIIRSLRFSFSFVSTSDYNLDFFLVGEDNRWLVEVYINTTSNPAIFTGFIVPEGCKDIFLDDELYGVELTASDLLQSVRESLLRKPDGTIPKGKFRLIDYISWCLQKTFLQLPIKVVNNLREETHTGADDCFFKMIYEEAMSFETDINEREDCLTVLQKILLGCFITQVNSTWWIVRVDEMDVNPYYVYSFAYDGTYLGYELANLTKRVGINEDINFVGENTEIYPTRQVQKVKQTFRFETWQELICNITYNRGTLTGSTTFPATSEYPSGYTFEYYTPECWLNGKNPHGSVTNTAVDVPGYIRKRIVNGYEVERVLVLPKLPGASTVHYYMTETFDVNKGDKFNFSADRRLDTDHTGSGTTHDSVYKIRLRGNDGTYWVMIGNDASGKVGSWKTTVGGFSAESFDIEYQTNSINETDWQNYSFETDPIPVNGRVEIMLLQSDVYGLVNDTHFANIRLEYIPIIDGVYQLVTGQYHKVYNTTDRKANVDEEIFISDAVSPNWKGVLFRYDGANYVRIGNVYDYRLNTSGGLGLDRFGAYQAFSLWNQYNRTIRKFQSNLKGLDTNIGAIPSMIYKFHFTDPSPATIGKLFQMLSFDMDLATCEWSANFSDVYGGSKDYVSDHEFNYTTK